MFGLLLLNANYIQVVRAKALHNDSRNPRLIQEEYSRKRGPILVGGKPVATSVATNGPAEVPAHVRGRQALSHR